MNEEARRATARPCNDEGCDGTSLQGYVDAQYSRIVEALGEPIDYAARYDGGDGKVDWSWVLRFEDGTLATIYNWKNGPGYGCDIEPSEITRWHVGGHSRKAEELVIELLADSPSATTLTELLDAIQDGRVELTDSLPDFGGEEPGCTAGVWSWDETHLLTGICVSDLGIVSREHHDAEILQQHAEAMFEDRELAEKAEWS